MNSTAWVTANGVADAKKIFIPEYIYSADHGVAYISTTNSVKFAGQNTNGRFGHSTVAAGANLLVFTTPDRAKSFNGTVSSVIM